MKAYDAQKAAAAQPKGKQGVKVRRAASMQGQMGATPGAGALPLPAARNSGLSGPQAECRTFIHSMYVRTVEYMMQCSFYGNVWIVRVS